MLVLHIYILIGLALVGGVLLVFNHLLNTTRWIKIFYCFGKLLPSPLYSLSSLGRNSDYVSQNMDLPSQNKKFLKLVLCFLVLFSEVWNYSGAAMLDFEEVSPYFKQYQVHILRYKAIVWRIFYFLRWKAIFFLRSNVVFVVDWSRNRVPQSIAKYMMPCCYKYE